MTEGIVAACEGVHDARPICWMWSTRHRRQARRVDGRLHLLLFVLCLTLLPGCMSSYSFVVPAAGWQPPMGATVLLLPPDVQLSLQRAGGLMEPRADWTLTAYNNLKSALAQEFEELGIDTVMYEEHGEASPWRPEHAGLVKLHEAVGAAILTSPSLPTQRGNLPHLDHSLGDTVRIARTVIRRTVCDSAPQSRGICQRRPHCVDHTRHHRRRKLGTGYATRVRFIS